MLSRFTGGTIQQLPKFLRGWKYQNSVCARVKGLLPETSAGSGAGVGLDSCALNKQEEG